MDFKEKVRQLLEEGMDGFPSHFLIDFTINSDYKISVVIDGDQGVTLKDCIAISRSIEHNLDREEQDFSLEVASVGVSTPLVMPRQYKKNIGRKLAITTIDKEKFEGKIIEVTDEFVVLEWKAREPKEIGKGKQTVTKIKQVNYNNIHKAIIQIVF